MSVEELSLKVNELSAQVVWLSKITYLLLFFIGVQLAVGMVLFGRIVEILTKSKRLLEITSKHGKLTDDQTACQVGAVNELRKDVRAVTEVAKTTAEQATEQVKQAVNTIVNLDSFRPVMSPSDSHFPK